MSGDSNNNKKTILNDCQQQNGKETADDNKELWFNETAALDFDDLVISTRINRLIHRQRSDYQNILIFQNQVFGRCLALDDAMQATELDECAYHEMIAFLPLNVHSDPKRVLIVGGGDGGVARECCKHQLVEQIVQCEIDQQVVEASKRYLPFMSQSFKNDKLMLNFQDGYEYVRKHPNEFDVIITDSCDPKGPAESLFDSEYYQQLFQCLRPGGVICSQAESYWYELKFIQLLFDKVGKIFPSVSYATTSVASYPSGQIGFLLASKEANVNFAEPKHRFTEQDCEHFGLKYYSESMHQASFVLPRFVRKALNIS
ncbi:spermidine synthase-like protein [Euroglyphus maynei]|uniref:Spermidine synthase-like protein n=1 Tax=Euroglyphus maynei TaxID=6958 RepID=A0A1Y3BKC3_EURMA|nr:spermidine synthase-like protein [Euroglyphus maynei]